MVSHRADFQQFLTTRRARLTPQDVGLSAAGTVRRVNGLRREEVAHLSGVSVNYYVRLERGHVSGVSDSVLHAIADALRLHDAERAHLFNLARAAAASSSSHTGSAAVAQGLRPDLRRILAAIDSLPAFVRNFRLDFLGANDLGRALHVHLFAATGGQPNGARFVFLDPRSRDYYLDWEESADDVVATLRAESMRSPRDQRLLDLVAELRSGSEDFASRWAAHNIRRQQSGTKWIRHPVVGDLKLTYEELELPSDFGLTLFIFLPRPGSTSSQALTALAQSCDGKF